MGSGGQNWRYRGIVEGWRRIDAGWLGKRGLLKDGVSGTVTRTSKAEWFQKASEAEGRFSQHAEGLAKFLHAKVMPYFQSHLAAAEGAPVVRPQAWGESLDPFRMDKLLALDERLTRQSEKVMGMLIRLQKMRLATPLKQIPSK